MRVISSDFIAVAENELRYMLPHLSTAPTTRGPIYRALVKAETPTPCGFRTELLLCVDTALWLSRASRIFIQLRRNISGYLKEREGKFSIALLMDNLVVDGKVINNDRRNKFLLVIDGRRAK